MKDAPLDSFNGPAQKLKELIDRYGIEKGGPQETIAGYTDGIKVRVEIVKALLGDNEK